MENQKKYQVILSEQQLVRLFDALFLYQCNTPGAEREGWLDSFQESCRECGLCFAYNRNGQTIVVKTDEQQ